MSPTTQITLAAAVLSIAAGLTQPAMGVTRTWQGTSGADWDTASNWTSAKPGSADLALFNSNISSVANGVADQSIWSISFDTSTGATTVGATDGNKLLLATAGTIQLLNSITGTGRTQTINSPVVIGSGSTAAVYAFSNAYTDDTSALVFGGPISGGTTNTVALTLSGVNKGDNEVKGIISDGSATALRVVKSGAGTWRLSGANTYSGGTTVNSNGGHLILGNASALGTGTLALNGNVSLSAAVDLSGSSAILNAVTLNNSAPVTIGGSHDITFGGTVTLHANVARTLTVNNYGTTTLGNIRLSDAAAGMALVVNGSGAVAITGAITNGGGGTNPVGAAGGGIAYAGNNTLTLSGANTYSAGTVIAGGTVSVNSLASAGVTFSVTSSTEGSNVITVSSATGLSIGQTITETSITGGTSNLAAGSTITAINGTSVTLSQSAVGSSSTPISAAAGVANNLGISTSAAANLILNGGTLKYTGAATSTNRLFTIAGNGGTIDSSGSGTLSFTHTGTVVTNPPSHVGSVTDQSAVVTFGTYVTTADLAVGMAVSGTGILEGTTIASIDSINTITLSQPATTTASPTLSFTGGAARTLTLTGSNNGSIASILANPSGTTLGIIKSGGGTWTLGGNNTYTGETRISAGTLALANSSTARISSGSMLNVAKGATFSDSYTAGRDLTFAGLKGAGSLSAGTAASRFITAGTIAPGDGGADALTITQGGLLVSDGAVYNYEINGTTASPVSDRIDLTGSGSTVTFGGAWTLNLSSLGTVSPNGKTFVLFDAASAISGAGTWSIGTLPSGWQGGAIGVNPDDATQIILTNVSIPEPTMMGALAAAATLLLGTRRRR